MNYQRETYASVLEDKKHPQASEFELALIDAQLSDNHDEIIKDIIDLLEKFDDLSDSSGEWVYINQQKRPDYIDALQTRDFDKLSALFHGLFTSQASYGLISPAYAETDHDDIVNRLLLDLDTCQEFTDFKNLSDISLQESMNSAYGLKVNDHVILPDSPRHYYFAHRISDLVSGLDNKAVMEIGAGYGGLIYFYNQFLDGKRPISFYDVDLLETLIVCFYFLRRVGIPVNFVFGSEDLDENQVNLIPSFLADQVLTDQKFGLVFNMHSFSEMGRETVHHYFEQIQNHYQPTFIYHQNSNFDCFPESERHIEVLSKDFPINPGLYKKAYASISPFICGSGRYREFLYKRQDD